jgi:hypothetical protein
MEKTYITITEYCESHEIGPDFISTLADEGLIDVTVVESSPQISADQLGALEMFTRLRYEMGVSPEGIDVIKNLLDRMQQLKAELYRLRERLAVYE